MIPIDPLMWVRKRSLDLNSTQRIFKRLPSCKILNNQHPDSQKRKKVDVNNGKELVLFTLGIRTWVTIGGGDVHD